MTAIGKTCSNKVSKMFVTAETCGLISSDCTGRHLRLPQRSCSGRSDVTGIAKIYRMVSITFGMNGKAKMERKTADSEWLSMQNETVTGLEPMNVGKRLCQIKCEWKNQTEDGKQMVKNDDDGQLQEMKRLEASSSKG
jgi:hypothetical protein